MTTLEVHGTPDTLLTHMALAGLGAILENAGYDTRLAWSRQTTPRATVVLDATPEVIGAVVRAHAAELTAPDSWLAADIELKGVNRGLMSPRLTPFGDNTTRRQVQQARHAILDPLTTQRHWFDLRQIAALGEPAYWSTNQKGDMLQDDGASRLEMQPRNQGSEIVGNRLRKLAAVVAARAADEVVAGLTGELVRDEVGNNKPDSRTATGFATLGPTDNALAWCALWGISQLPIAMRVSRSGRGAAVTTGHLGRRAEEWFYAPLWHEQWRPARLRTMWASAQLRTAAAAGLPLGERSVTDTDSLAASIWLTARQVAGVIRFPIERFGSDNAPERRAQTGHRVSLGKPVSAGGG